MRLQDTTSTDTVQALGVPLKLTRFPSRGAYQKKELTLSLADLARWIKDQRAASKDALPWLKLATFGPDLSRNNSLRHNANVRSVTGLEADYDGGTVTPEAARDALKAAGVAALIYTTPRHSPNAPRWRVLAPFSGPLPPAEREDLMARLNGVLGGDLDPASFTLSQSYYAGNVEGGTPVRTFLVDGQPIDCVEGLKPRYKDGSTKKRAAPKKSDVAREGLPIHHVREAVLSIPNDDSNPDAAERDWWLKIGMGIHHETEGSDDGLAVFHAFSERHPTYDPDETETVWHSFGGGGRAPVTFATIRREAGPRGWIDLSGFDSELDADELAEIDALIGMPTPEVEAEGRNLTRAYALDEDGVIRAFTDRHQHELQFDHHAGRWFRFDGQHWQREETLLAKHYARDLSTTLAARDPRAKALKKVSVWEAIERGARTAREFACKADQWDRDPFLLGTPGGTVELKTGRLRKARPADYIAKVTAVAPIPLDSFDPARECPQWLAFLDEALDGDAGAIRFLQQWGGYSLTGDTREHTLVFVYGPGGSGKSTAINTIADVAGDYSINVPTSTLTAAKYDAHPEELARLDGARLAWASETEKGRAWAENRIKSLTGGDTITARFMRQDSFSFVPKMKLTIIGNNRPSLTDVDAAIRRRFIVLPFDHPPTTKDTELPAKLKAEWPGILSWLILGALDWHQNGLIRPAVVEDATNEYFDEQDTFGQWLDECCEVGESHHGYIATTDSLYTSWQQFAFANGADPGTKRRTFPETMQQRGFVAVKNRGGIRGRGFAGIRLAQDPEAFTDDLI